tara:strand:- start:2452 stop:2883 length:432 start_codon:yes stop_codon:yes gene_type:complete
MPILNRKENNDILSQNPRVNVGIDFPTAIVPDGDGFFKGTKTTEDAIKSNIRLLLLTQRGERVMQPNLGINLRRFLFEPITENTAVEIENDIVQTFSYWLPFVQIRDIQIDLSSQDANQIGIKLIFKVKNGSDRLSSVQVDIG